MITKKIIVRKKLENILRFSALGGLEEIGRNMAFFEYQNEIIIIDMGLQFPEEETPGIDFIIPNVSYLEKKKNHIKAIILTHAHYDHIGAVPYLIQKLGNPVIYTTALTKEIVIKRQEEFINLPKLNIKEIKTGDKIKLSNYFEAEFFGVSHNIPDTAGVIIKTPVGDMVYLSDFKFDYDNEGNAINLEEFKILHKQKIHTLFIDSTNAEVPGKSISERTVEKNLEELFKKANGRIIIAIFASLLTRISEILKIGEKLNKKIAISGRSMKDNVEIAKRLNYIKLSKGTVIPVEEVNKYKDDKIMILSTGAQGEPNASLVKIINGEHRHLRVKPGDTFIFSSSIIPGNEKSVQGLRDSLARQKAIVYHSKIIDIHSSGHATQEELQIIIKLIKPSFVFPIHGHFFMRAQNGQNAVETGIPKENILLADNGQIIHITENSAKISKETVPAFYIMVDGLGVGDVEEVVLRDRRLLAQEGMIVIIVTLNRRTGRLMKNPDIVSRGFIYLKENQKMVEEIRTRVKEIINKTPRSQIVDADYFKSIFRNRLGQFVYTETNRRPMILPVIIEI
ncbi:MAG: ribonuclease J [Candidatus Liptonbacteria bacterium]|nr:ribonuclease J [Candidatus Liptonbacteria bacterium]